MQITVHIINVPKVRSAGCYRELLHQPARASRPQTPLDSRRGRLQSTRSFTSAHVCPSHPRSRTTPHFFPPWHVLVAATHVGRASQIVPMAASLPTSAMSAMPKACTGETSASAAMLICRIHGVSHGPKSAWASLCDVCRWWGHLKAVVGDLGKLYDVCILLHVDDPRPQLPSQHKVLDRSLPPIP